MQLLSETQKHLTNSKLLKGSVNDGTFLHKNIKQMNSVQNKPCQLFTSFLSSQLKVCLVT